VAASLPDPFRQIVFQSLAHDPQRRTITMADIAATLS
jgi:hypothetical protein